MSTNKVIGVYPAQNKTAFRAAIGFKSADIHLGYYHVEEDAINARAKAEKILKMDASDDKKLNKLLEIAKEERIKHSAANAGYKHNLMQEIADWYGYKLKIDKDRTVTVAQAGGIILPYKNVDVALKDWLSTLKESNSDALNAGEKELWGKEEIQFIESL